jgi:hypothetical protein
MLVDPLAVTDQHVIGLDGEQPPRRGQPQQRRDAEALSRRTVVPRSADRLGADERPLLREPERDLVPPAPPQERQHLERRTRRGLRWNLVVGDAELLGDGAAVTAVPVEQLQDAGRVAELASAPSATSSATGSITQTRPSAVRTCDARSMKCGSGAIQPNANPISSTKRTRSTPTDGTPRRPHPAPGARRGPWGAKIKKSTFAGGTRVLAPVTFPRGRSPPPRVVVELPAPIGLRTRTRADRGPQLQSPM